MADELIKKARKLGKSNVMQEAFEAEAAEIAKTVLRLAKCGEPACIKLVVERLAPTVRERSVAVPMPIIGSVTDLPPAVAQLLAQSQPVNSLQAKARSLPVCSARGGSLWKWSSFSVALQPLRSVPMSRNYDPR